jgi:hypothetical protein
VDREKFNLIKQRFLVPEYGNELAPKSKPTPSHCDDCDQIVLGHRISFYVRGMGTKNMTWVKRCENCKKITPISSLG